MPSPDGSDEDNEADQADEDSTVSDDNRSVGPEEHQDTAPSEHSHSFVSLSSCDQEEKITLIPPTLEMIGLKPI